MADDEKIVYGLTANGFRRKRLPEILKSINTRVSNTLGVDIETGSNSIFGQIHGVYAYELADIWETAEDTYNAMYPGTATGVSLSNSAGMAGILPNAGTKSTVTLICYGDNGTSIAYRAQVNSRLENGNLWECNEVNARITSQKAYSVAIVVETAIAKGVVYTLTVDGKTVTYTATGSEDVVAVLNGLAKQVARDDIQTSIDNNVLSLQAAGMATFAVSASGVKIQNIGTPVQFQCSAVGAVNPRVGTITQILTSTAGWSGVTNPVAANVGVDAESDTALRQRWNKSLYMRAGASVEAIRAAILNDVTGVSECLVYENNEDFTDDEGRPPHSVEVIVLGGDDNDIGKKIMDIKTAGVKTFGAVSVSVLDNMGNYHDMYFNRPTPVKLWLKVVISGNPDETLSPNAINDITSALMTKGQEQKIGEDVILQRYFATIFQSTTGVGYINLTAATGDTAKTYGSGNISISAQQIAVFDLSRIEVTTT